MGLVEVLVDSETYSPGDPVKFLITRREVRPLDVVRVEAVNGRGEIREIRSGDRLPETFGVPVLLRIHPRRSGDGPYR